MPRIDIETRVINNSYDNEKDRNWYISEVSESVITLKNKRFGTRPTLANLNIPIEEFISMAESGILEVENFSGDKVDFLDIAVDNLKKECLLKKNESERQRLKRYESAVKKNVEKRKVMRISERQKKIDEIDLEIEVQDVKNKINLLEEMINEMNTQGNPSEEIEKLMEEKSLLEEYLKTIDNE